MKIYCPLCEYRPSASDRWQCRPGCHTVWNTFETRARCPGCSKQWRDTWCPACGVQSPHEDWYHDEVTDQEVEAYEEELAGVG
jgi:predicted amidophosphoribosyltransferase